MIGTEYQCGMKASKSTHTDHPLLVLERRNDSESYKCLVCVSRSSPGEVVDEIGIGPESWLSAKSSQKRLLSRPIEAGILPVKLFELSALQSVSLIVHFTSIAQEEAERWQEYGVVIKISYQSKSSYKNESCTKFPNSWGMPPVKLQAAKILNITMHWVSFIDSQIVIWLIMKYKNSPLGLGCTVL